MTAVPRIVALVCSPGGSRSQRCAEQVLYGAAATGARTEILEVPDGRPREEVLARITAADGYLFAAPTYRGQAAWPLKALLDHIDRDAEGNSSLTGKAGAVALTAASAHHFLAAEPTRTILTEFFALQLISPSLYMYGDHFDPNGALTVQAERSARDTGAALASAARWTMAEPCIGALRPHV